MCFLEGTRLVVPNDMPEFDSLTMWIMKHADVPERVSTDDQLSFLRYRNHLYKVPNLNYPIMQQKSVFLFGYRNFPMTNQVSPANEHVIRANNLPPQLSSCYYSAPAFPVCAKFDAIPRTIETYGVCHYKDCITTSGKLCSFPFR